MIPTPPPTLAALHAEIDPAPEPMPWWVRWDVVPMVAILCIAVTTAFAIGRL